MPRSTSDTWASSYEWEPIREAAIHLLTARNHADVAAALASLPFELVEGTNAFGDEFHVLTLSLPVDSYLATDELRRANPRLFAGIASVVSEVGPFVRFVTLEVGKIQGIQHIPNPVPKVTSAVVDRALEDAEQLLRSQGPVSAFDRVHTAMHGYFKVVLERAGIVAPADASVPALFKLIQSQHPDLVRNDPHAEQIRHLLRSSGSIIESLNTLRNRASAAHPNEDLLEEAEAALAINLGRTLLHYLNASREFESLTRNHFAETGCRCRYSSLGLAPRAEPFG